MSVLTWPIYFQTK